MGCEKMKLSEYNPKNSTWIRELVDELIEKYKGKKTYAEIADLLYRKTRGWKLKNRVFAFMILGFWMGKRKQAEDTFKVLLSILKGVKNEK